MLKLKQQVLVFRSDLLHDYFQTIELLGQVFELLVDHAFFPDQFILAGLRRFFSFTGFFQLFFQLGECFILLRQGIDLLQYFMNTPLQSGYIEFFKPGMLLDTAVGIKLLL